MAANLTAGADQRLDTQLDHVLEELLLAKGGNHEIRQMFKECNVYQFEDFVEYEVEQIEEMKRKQHNATKTFDTQKVTQVYNMIRYYNFLQSNNIVLAEDPENWVKAVFFKLRRDNRRHLTVASANAVSANAALPGVNTTKILRHCPP